MVILDDIMLYIVLAYLMLFAALTNAVCLYNASFFPLSINQSINQVYFQINMYKNEQKVHISQIDRKKVEVEVSNL